MLNFDEARFLKIQRGAIAQLDPIRDLVQRLVPRIDSLFFLGTGGAQILMQPAALLMQRRSHLPTFVESAAEIVVDGSANLGANALVVIPSLSGTTKESIAAADFAEERGGTVVCLVGHAETPLGKQADYPIVNFAEDDTSSESFYIQSIGLALSLLAARGEMADAARILDGLRVLPEALLDAKRAFEPRAADLAQAFRDEPYHIITGAGSSWPQAWYYGMCILEEMQWIRTRPVHASDFFHGTLELVEEGVSVIVLKGEDSYRPLAERVENFARRYTRKVTVIDTADFALPGVDADVRPFVSPMVLATVLERLSAHLEVLREHPLTTRRYYKRVDY